MQCGPASAKLGSKGIRSWAFPGVDQPTLLRIMQGSVQAQPQSYSSKEQIKGLKPQSYETGRTGKIVVVTVVVAVDVAAAVEVVVVLGCGSIVVVVVVVAVVVVVVVVVVAPGVVATVVAVVGVAVVLAVVTYAG